ncbi:hypothetical protein THRCLA_01656 [Thraustotheca clavata]|uniref:WRKY19-like zinc finger domain-containing protein n=1 Tax=Thraustotheca clavata TaxID=74557 RepID=A0A1W0A7U5_9STRA|nr:hypothetical protein THRCLA_01656 [Thraustotheca clavata]
MFGLNDAMLNTSEDLWDVENILGSEPDWLEMEKDLLFLDTTSTLLPSPPSMNNMNTLHIQVDNLNFVPDSTMDQVFASEPCYSPEPKPKQRNSLDMLTLEPLPLDHLSFVAQPTKRKSIVKINPAPPQVPIQVKIENQFPPTVVPTKLISPKKCKQCITPGCTRRAQSNNRCKSHGGGARCTVPNCGKSSQGGGLCRAHGGGKKCKAPGCTKGTQRLGLCYLHGGIRRCTSPGCEKKDRGNGFCISHGGGRKCATPRCTRPARRGNLCQVHEELKLATPTPGVLLTLQCNTMNPDPIAFMGRAILQSPH